MPSELLNADYREVAFLSTTFEGKLFQSLGVWQLKGLLINSSNPCRDTIWYRWHNAGSRTRAGTVLRVGEGNPNVIIFEII